MRFISLAVLVLFGMTIFAGEIAYAAPRKAKRSKKLAAISKKVATKPSALKTKTTPKVTGNKIKTMGVGNTVTSSIASLDPVIDQRIIDMDITPPNTSITSPTGLRIENYADTSITLTGESSDDLKIANVKWYTTRDVSGDCTGIENWKAENIPLFAGENLITIAATDLAGNIGADCITVVCTAKIDIKIAVPTTVTSKQVLTISVIYTNSGAADVNNLTVIAKVPDVMDYIAGSAEASGGTWNAATRTVSWVINTLPAQQSGTKTYKAKVK